MYLKSKIHAYLFASIIIFSLSIHGTAGSMPGQETAGEHGSNSQSEAAALERIDKLLSENKVDEALAELEKVLQENPGSMVLARKKYEILFSSKRFEECLQMLNAIYPVVPAEVQRDIMSGKRMVLFELTKQSMERGDTDTALKWMDDLANAGYRGFHDINRNELFKPLWSLPQYKEIQKKIGENAGIGSPARDFSTTLMTGEDFALSDQKGRIILVDFWSTFCVPCKEELPNLRDLYKTYRDKGFEIISISLNTDEKILDKFLVENPMPWKTVFSGKGFNGDLARLYEVTWVPSYWLIDRKGVLRYHDVRGKDLRNAVVHLIEEK
jgi:thiol-disulfide isomerase/thioredoxin